MKQHLHLMRPDVYKIIFYILLLNTSKSNVGFVELRSSFYLLLKIVKCQIVRRSKLSASSLKNCLWINVEGKRQGYTTVDTCFLQLFC